MRHWLCHLLGVWCDFRVAFFESISAVPWLPPSPLTPWGDSQDSQVATLCDSERVRVLGQGGERPSRSFQRAPVAQVMLSLRGGTALTRTKGPEQGRRLNGRRPELWQGLSHRHLLPEESW